MTISKKILYAEYWGSLLPKRSWRGSVQSIYSKAVNLLHPSGILISIVDSIDDMTDLGLVVVDFSSLISGISNGSQFLWEENQIIFSKIIVDISRASVWSGVLSGKSFKINPDIVSIKSAFGKLAVKEGLSPVITQKAGNMYSNAAGKIIEKAIKEAGGKANVSDGLLIHLGSFVGMGIGFTPSGDDFLAGVMLYETMSGNNWLNRESIKARLSGTTEGGRTLLILALRNSFPFYLKQFAESILNGKFTPAEVIKKVINHGSTSGSDALTGFLWAAEKIN